MTTKSITTPQSKIADFETILAFAEISNDFNPLHVDKAFAAATSYGALIAHGPMSTGLLLTSLVETMTLNELIGSRLTLRFKKPVREGDCVLTRSTPVEGSPDQRVWIENQDGDVVIEGVFSPGQTKSKASTERSDPSE